MYCKVTEQIFELTRLIEDAKKKPKDYGNGILLYHAEVQLLDTISRYPEENVSGLSELLGITKGAITQIVEKLRHKELIITVSRKDNKKEKYFCLTDQGQIWMATHRSLHKQSNESICNFINTLNPNEVDAVFRFLDQLKQCIPFSEFQCSHTHMKENNKEENHYETNTVECARTARHT